ncbi:MAG: iron-containing alcohol dehydrogenase [Bauldia sp.]
MATLSYLTTTLFDFGAVKRLPKALARLGIQRPMITTDKGVVAAGLCQRVTAAMGDGEIPIFDRTPENPTEAAVMAAVALYRESDADGIVAVGGGSAIDLGKATALMALNARPLLDYAGIARGQVGHVAPLVAIPTTAGTGSEVSVGFIVIVEDGRKLTFIADQFVPRLAICDPELTFGLPPTLTAATGMDAVTHCIEAVLSPVVNPPAEAIGIDGLERAVGAGNLVRAVVDGSDREARWQMMMVATEGAMAFVKGLGAVHAMSHSAGRLTGLRLHHGTLNAILLPHVLRFNSGTDDGKYRRIARAMNLPPDADLAEAIRALNSQIALPSSLGAMGISNAHLPELVEHAVADLAGATNPRKASADDYLRLFAEAIG